MSKEKQIIEEMKYDICTAADYCYGACEECNLGRLAEHLYNAGYRKQSEWIRVEERLPENEKERVLVMLKDAPFVVHIGTPKIDTDRYMDGSWVRWDGYITHWMPLPEAPKGGAE